MKKQYHIRQRFEFQKYDSNTGQWQLAGYLLMPNEVTEFYHYINDLEFTFDKTFERITNKVIIGDNGNAYYRDIKLVVETVKAW
jgi:hypothetical protein